MYGTPPFPIKEVSMTIIMTMTKISNNNNDNADLTNINKNNVKHAANNQIKHFVICESCFWCTTYLINNVIAVPKCCPMCNNAKEEVLTVANDL